jgi:hypothetical protein
MFCTFLDHLRDYDAATWTAWGTWAYTVLTFLLALGAIGAWMSSRNQLGLMRDQFTELRAGREAQTRPILRVRSIGLVPSDQNGVLVRVTVQNAGPGPAMQWTVQVWNEPRLSEILTEQVVNSGDRPPTGTATSDRPVPAGVTSSKFLVIPDAKSSRLLVLAPPVAGEFLVHLSYEGLEVGPYHDPGSEDDSWIPVIWVRSEPTPSEARP